MMKIYQIYYNEKTFSRLDKEFIPYNYNKNESTDWYEFACKIAVKMCYNPLKKIMPVNSKHYRSIVIRPLNFRLDNLKNSKNI